MIPATEESSLRDAIVNRLRMVIDPETDAYVIRMQLVDGLMIHKRGRVSYTFRPSSSLCPLAVFLATQIKDAVAEVPGVSSQQIRVEGYVAAEHLTKLRNEEN